MELAGDEKRIQALFSESALQEQSAAPEFAELWLSATRKIPAHARDLSKSRARSVSKPLLAVAAVLLIAAASWGAWSWFRSPRSSQQQVINITPETISPPALDVVQQTKDVTPDVPFKHHAARQNKRRTRQPDRSAITEAALLSHWRSPTRLLIKSPATVDFNSLPQLNQSAGELKQFLPRNTELTKESNQ